jgi:SAM-dependent methyltransferase
VKREAFEFGAHWKSKPHRFSPRAAENNLIPPRHQKDVLAKPNLSKQVKAGSGLTMHDTAMEIGAAFFNTYLKDGHDLTIVDIGSQDVNGSLRSVAPKNNKYIGLDFESGKGVDVVITDPYSLPFENESVDVAVSSSCFEHSEFFWLLFNESLRILKPTGLLYINAPSNGWYHRYPVDCWRFYPDSGVALQNWSNRSGYKCALLESFIGMRKDELWNDFTAVFVKDEGYRAHYSKRIQDTSTPFENGRRYGSEDIINFSLQSQDQSLLGAEKDARVAERSLIGAERDAAISDKDAAISEKDAATAERDAAISEKDAAIAERDAVISEKNAAIAERDVAIAERDAAISEKHATTAERDVAIAERDAAISEKHAATAERDTANSERDAATSERDAILHSRTWRITAPLRYLRGVQIRLFTSLKP